MKSMVRHDLYIREIADEKVVYDKANGKVHFLNQTATFIFDLCDGKNTQEDIVKHLMDKYEVDRDKAERDVEEILRNLEKNIIIKRVDP